MKNMPSTVIIMGLTPRLPLAVNTRVPEIVAGYAEHARRKAERIEHIAAEYIYGERRNIRRTVYNLGYACLNRSAACAPRP